MITDEPTITILPIQAKIAPRIVATANLPAFPKININAFHADMQKFELVKAI